jgi:hypothetical protein
MSLDEISGDSTNRVKKQLESGFNSHDDFESSESTLEDRVGDEVALRRSTPEENVD